MTKRSFYLVALVQFAIALFGLNRYLVMIYSDHELIQLFLLAVVGYVGSFLVFRELILRMPKNYSREIRQELKERLLETVDIDPQEFNTTVYYYHKTFATVVAFNLALIFFILLLPICLGRGFGEDAAVEASAAFALASICLFISYSMGGQSFR
jgi:hypothetical protein